MAPWWHGWVGKARFQQSGAREEVTLNTNVVEEIHKRRACLHVESNMLIQLVKNQALVVMMLGQPLILTQLVLCDHQSLTFHTCSKALFKKHDDETAYTSSRTC